MGGLKLIKASEAKLWQVKASKSWTRTNIKNNPKTISKAAKEPSKAKSRFFGAQGCHCSSVATAWCPSGCHGSKYVMETSQENLIWMWVPEVFAALMACCYYQAHDEQIPRTSRTANTTARAALAAPACKDNLFSVEAKVVRFFL